MSWTALPRELTTERLQLDAWRDEDVEPYLEMIYERDPRAKRAPRDGRPDRAEVQAAVRERAHDIDDTGIALLVVRLDDMFLGYCGLTVGQASLDEPEIAYELLRRHHGNGYATEAAGAIVSAAASTGRSRLWATVRPWNDPSFRVLSKLGFTDSGRRTEDDFGESHWWTRPLRPGTG